MSQKQKEKFANQSQIKIAKFVNQSRKQIVKFADWSLEKNYDIHKTRKFCEKNHIILQSNAEKESRNLYICCTSKMWDLPIDSAKYQENSQVNPKIWSSFQKKKNWKVKFWKQEHPGHKIFESMNPAISSRNSSPVPVMCILILCN